jgi:DNA (cytosine-5)-methyltransferase 1
MTHGSLFSGIGGFDLAAEWMGWENLFHCEWNEFGQKVLNHYWPDAELFTDITKSDFTKYANQIDILSGGFPCQPYSHAGKRLGKEDERHLWPEMCRAIRQIQPTWVVGENVSGLISWNGGLVFDEVQTDLEAEGYEVFPVVLPACAVNAPHRRDRVWFVAYSEDRRINRINGNDTGKTGEDRCRDDEFNGSSSGPTPNSTSNRRQRNGQGIEIEKGLQPGSESAGQLERGFEGLCNTGDVANTESKRYQQSCTGNKEFSAQVGPGLHGRSSFEHGGCGTWQNFPTQSPVCTGNDGLSSKLDGITFSKWRNESIKAAGNAVVPQLVVRIFKAIQQMTNQQKR